MLSTTTINVKVETDNVLVANVLLQAPMAGAQRSLYADLCYRTTTACQNRVGGGG